MEEEMELAKFDSLKHDVIGLDPIRHCSLSRFDHLGELDMTRALTNLTQRIVVNGLCH